MAKGKRKPDDKQPRIVNRRAKFDYAIGDTYEVGLSLIGSEVKSLREGQANLTGSYAKITPGGQLQLWDAQIDAYRQAGPSGYHEVRRIRPLLAHKREIRKLQAEAREPGVSLVPLQIYWKGGRAKLELAVARGKQAHDKRESLKRKVQDRELRRAMTSRQ
jgi:SsrA-binding protein